MLKTSASMPAEANSLRLLVLSSEPQSSAAVAGALRSALGAAVDVVTSLHEGHEALRNAGYHAVLLEEVVFAEHPDALEKIYELAGDASVVEVSFGLVNATRVVRQVRHARQLQLASDARQQMAARKSIQMELLGALAGLRLQSELALRTTGPELEFHLTALAHLAEAIALQVQIGGSAPLRSDDLHLREEVRQTPA